MDDGRRDDDRRAARRAAALRENLKRRKAQVRARADAERPAMPDPRARALLDFWFGAPGTAGHGAMRKAWFEKDAAFDAELRARFAGDHARAAAGACDHWQDSAAGALALVVLLDRKRCYAALCAC